MLEKEENQSLNKPVAIIGMGCLFPDSPSLKAYWKLILNGNDAITDIPDTHWATDAYFDEDPQTPDHVYCKKGAFLPPIAFDPSEFGIPPSSLEATDTSQLLALKTAKNALSHAGYGSEKTFNRERTSVILGVTGTQELVIPLGSRLGHPIWRRAMLDEGLSAETTHSIINRISDAYVPWQENSFPGLLGNVVAGRICNRLDLGGTNCVVDAACASSMSAIHLAILELQSERSDMVVSGGVDTINDIFMHMCFAKTLILSKSGDIRPFSKEADGTILGEGIGMLVLKRLADAEKDGDDIHAVIKGIGTSSDGKSQSIYAPCVTGQANALQMAYQNARIEPKTIRLIEAHGTGTRVGDKVELDALKKVYGSTSGKPQQTAIGSVKSMIGHTKAAAGSAGLIKTTLALKNKVLPPTLKAENPDPELELEKSPFYISSKTRPWLPSEQHPRRAAVSSFGFGGSNFHLVLEEHTQQKQTVSWDGSVEIFTFSATTKKDILQKLDNLMHAVKEIGPGRGVHHLAAESRDRFRHDATCRLVFVYESKHTDPDNHKPLRSIIENAATRLQQKEIGVFWNKESIFYAENKTTEKLAFLFPGQGSQYVYMGCDLVNTFPEALDALDLTNRLCKRDLSIGDIVYPVPTNDTNRKRQQEAAIRQTDAAQPAIGGISMGMGKILERFGIKPDAVCGHSYGELTALQSAGCIDAETFALLSDSRGRAMAMAADNGPEGTMLAVKAPLDKIKELIQDIPDVILANLNSPNQGVLSGPAKGIEQAESILKQKGFRGLRLPVSAAFHSSLMDEAKQPFEHAVQSSGMHPATIPVYSNTTGHPYPLEEVKAKTLLGDQMMNPVCFSDTIENLYSEGIRTFVEVGPKSILTGLVRTILKRKPFHAIAMDASAGRGSGIFDLALTIARLTALGHPTRLDAWEDPVAHDRKQRMTVMLNGANIRSEKRLTPSPGDKRNRTHSLLKDKYLKTVSGKTDGHTGVNTNPKPIKPKTPMNTNKQIQKENVMSKPVSSPHVKTALQTVSEGLKSMQALQARTAEAHQKFLETQAEAGRTLQQMMESTRRLAEASLGITDTAALQMGTADAMKKMASDITPEPPAVIKPVSESQPIPDTAIPESNNRCTQTAPATSNSSGTQSQKENQTGNASKLDTPRLSNTLLEVVSELTGYPTDMLNMDMDIEADLGIDSIKRVEILSTLEERMPHLPSVKPDMMGTLKTLGQITGYLSGQTPSVFTADSPGETDLLPAAPSSPADTDQSDLSADLSETLLTIVSDLTGYPPDMLDLDLDIEADLGIDSIKRVEILSTMEEKAPGLPQITPDLMGSLKTLGQIVDFLTSGTKETWPGTDSRPEPQLPNPETNTSAPIHAQTIESRETSQADTYDHYLMRRAVTLTESPRGKGTPLLFTGNRKIYILEDDNGLAEQMVKGFASRKIETVLLTRKTASQILNNEETLTQAAGLIIFSDDHLKSDREQDRHLKTAFQLARAAAPALIQAASKSSAALFATITRLDGAFGFRGNAVVNPVMGGLAGLVKTAAIEWPTVTCRALDIDPQWDDHQNLIETVVDELLDSGAPVPKEIGLSAGNRCTLTLSDLPSLENKTKPTDLGPDDVVVMTGGARGVTAAAAVTLAENSGSKLVLMGRSNTPAPEPVWLEGVHKPADMKKAILENEFNNNGASPKDIEHSYTRHQADREIRETLHRLEEIGVEHQYVSTDIRNRTEVEKSLKKIRESMGPITAIIHGAGVIADHLIVDKIPKEFDRVYDTKVVGLRNLLSATHNDPIRHLALFSSVTARIGNTGQADYAMANEVLNKMAWQFANQHPDCKTLSLNWGPWDGGMVTPGLKRIFQKQNIGLIPLESGAMSLLTEMGEHNQNPVEIVIGSDLNNQSDHTEKRAQPQNSANELAQPDSVPMSLSFKKEIDTTDYPILQAHVIGGKPVVPFALITEWFGHGALHENPGLLLHGIDDMRILKGVKIEAKKKLIRLFAGKPSRKESHFEVSVELRDGVMEGADVIHSRGKAILTDSIPEAPKIQHPLHEKQENYHRSIQDVYNDILFHGAELHGIRKIVACSSKGMTALVTTAPEPHSWIKEPLRSGWIADPLALDAAFQMASVWCFEETGKVSLPSYCASYRQYCSVFPEDDITARLDVTDLSERKMTGNFILIDGNSRVIAEMKGYEAVMDASLYQAFKPEKFNND